MLLSREVRSASSFVPLPLMKEVLEPWKPGLYLLNTLHLARTQTTAPHTCPSPISEDVYIISRPTCLCSRTLPPGV